MYGEDAGVGDLLGKTLSAVHTVGDEELLFTTTNGEQYRMYHSQNCCESVTIEDICGNLADLVGLPLLIAEAVMSENPWTSLAEEAVSRLRGHESSGESETWTFYKFATQKGHVTIRWYGNSNGYYSESVDFEKVKEDDPYA